MSRQIRTSAKAVIIQNDKLLAIKLNDGKEEWYILPGGGQDCEEMLPQTVEREVREEAGIEVKCKDFYQRESRKSPAVRQRKRAFLWHHPRKYIVPAVMLLLAGGVLTCPAILPALPVLLAVEIVIFLFLM